MYCLSLQGFARQPSLHDGGAVIYNVGLWHYDANFTFLNTILNEVGEPLSIAICNSYTFHAKSCIVNSFVTRLSQALQPAAAGTKAAAKAPAH